MWELELLRCQGFLLSLYLLFGWTPTVKGDILRHFFHLKYKSFYQLGTELSVYAMSLKPIKTCSVVQTWPRYKTKNVQGQFHMGPCPLGGLA
jgi:hypothetical protein